MREFDLKTLAEFDGAGGKPVYIAHGGKVYDVTGSRLWKGGVHRRLHHGGEDLTGSIEDAPHGPEMLRRYPQIGVLKDA